MDAVVIQAVLEHVLDPDQVVREIHRVLRPGGLIYAETPFLQQVHAGPYDFTRYTASGRRAVFRSRTAGVLARAAFSWLLSLDRLASARFALDDASACYFLGRRAERELTPSEIRDYYGGAQRISLPRPLGDQRQGRQRWS